MPEDYPSAEVFDEIDQYAMTVPNNVQDNLEELVSYLVEPATNDFEKTRAIYVWITHNISYY